MKPDKREAEYKKLLLAKARIDELYRLMAALPRKRLEKKIFAGHWRFFKVRDDILRSSIGEAAKLVVDKCNTYVLGNKKNPKSYEKWHGTEYCRYFGEITVSKQTLQSLSQEQIDKIDFPNRENFIRKWFHVAEKVINVGSKNIIRRRYIPKIPPHMLEFAYKPAYITEVSDKAGDYESELAKLNDYFYRKNGWAILYGRNRCGYEGDYAISKKKKIRQLQEKEIREELE